ncbi:uncharacterized protein [Physcomitrium patens]|uniref:uncharacterized protein n=1 Tax=Physcomitrium patens TaxID=3218 RepID=UPI003CCE0E9C
MPSGLWRDPSFAVGFASKYAMSSRYPQLYISELLLISSFSFAFYLHARSVGNSSNRLQIQISLSTHTTYLLIGTFCILQHAMVSSVDMVPQLSARFLEPSHTNQD